jgi:hypothetical protein
VSTIDAELPLVARLRTRSRAVFLAAEESPAQDLSNHLRDAADEIERLRNAAIDALAGWKYIREHHGDLYGVGWDRVQTALEASLAVPSRDQA